MSDKPKVISLSVRRKTVSEDPVLILADRLTKVIAEMAPTMSPEEQIVGIELAASAAAETMKHAFGLSELNAIIVEANRRRRTYTLGWPDEDESPTCYDGQRFDREKAKATPIRRIDGGIEEANEEDASPTGSRLAEEGGQREGGSSTPEG